MTTPVGSWSFECVSERVEEGSGDAEGRVRSGGYSNETEGSLRRSTSRVHLFADISVEKTSFVFYRSMPTPDVVVKKTTTAHIRIYCVRMMRTSCCDDLAREHGLRNICWIHSVLCLGSMMVDCESYYHSFQELLTVLVFLARRSAAAMAI